MSIKYKIPAMMMVVFAINIVVLLLFFQFYSVPYLAGAIVDYQSETDATLRDAAEAVDGMPLEAASDHLRDLTQQNTRLSFTLEHIGTRQQTFIPALSVHHLGFSAFQPVALSGETYILSLWRDIGVLESVDGTLHRLTLLELIVLSLSFVVCSVILHWQYVRPVLRLKEKTVDYLRTGEVIEPTARGDELGALENGFSRMTMELAEEKRKQNRIIASISHDIKTPLTSLMGFAERLIKKDLGAEKQKAYLNNIYTQARGIESIVEDFDEYLDGALEGQLKTQRVEASFLCGLLMDEYREPLAERGATFSVLSECAEGTAMNLDLLRMRRVFANLIGNALRHNDPRGLAVTIRCGEYGNLVVFTVEDSGKGAKEQDLPHLFEPFYTSDKSRKVSGLGLSICDQIVRAHGGTIRAENTESGFAVRVSIPKA